MIVYVDLFMVRLRPLQGLKTGQSLATIQVYVMVAFIWIGRIIMYKQLLKAQSNSS